MCGDDARAHEVVRRLEHAALGMAPEAHAGERVRVQHVARGFADEAVAGRHHLVVSCSPGSVWSDLLLTSGPEADTLAAERLAPWVTWWQRGERAPRARVAVLAAADPTWAPTARRLIARLRVHTNALRVHRIDHIGSTSVSGLAAKDLIDIQIAVPSEIDALDVARAATGAGFVHVSGDWHGKDRHGNRHLEQVCVNADPARPVNINIRSIDRPVARDALLFRDWLRANTGARDGYAMVKSDLAGQHVDTYSERKEPHIAAALDEAEAWATRSGWTW